MNFKKFFSQEAIKVDVDINVDEAVGDNNEVILDVDVNLDNVEDVEKEVSSEVSEIESNVDDIESGEAQIEEIETEKEDLDNVGEMIEEKVKDDETLSPIAAEQLAFTFKRLNRKYGIDVSSSLPRVSKENFESVSTAGMATRMALEEVEKASESLGSKIKNALSKIWEWVLNLLEKIVAFGNSLKIKTNKLRKEIKKLPKDFEVVEIQSTNTINKAFPTEGDLDSGEVRNFLTKVSDSYEDVLRVVLSQFGSVVGSEAMKTDINSWAWEVLAVMGDRFELGTESQPLPTGVYATVKIISPEEGGEGRLEFEKTSLDIKVKEDRKVFSPKSASALEDILVSIEANSKLTVDIRDKVKKIGVYSKKFVEKYSSDNYKGDNTEMAKQVEGFIKQGSELCRNLITFMVRVENSGVVGGLSYVAESIKAVSGASKPTEETKEV